MLLLLPAAHARVFTIQTVGGPVRVEVSHVGPKGALASPSAPQLPVFGPPSIFSAPLPTGSGARALGLAGAFTAVADDATAASWNPAGLVQLERPEASAVVRSAREENRHHSDATNFEVGENRFGSSGLNYFSLVLPFRFIRRNWVFSANYQEAYDFTQRFTADLTQRSRHTDEETETEDHVDVDRQHITDGIVEIDVTSYLSTHIESFLTQLSSSELLTFVDFEQEGIIAAISPALAVEITPKVSFGTAVNFYHDGYFGGQTVRSVTRATYSGKSTSQSHISTVRATQGTYSYDGVVHWPVVGDRPISGSGTFPSFSDTSESESRDAVYFEGEYEEINEYRNFEGINATLGVLWTFSRMLSFGASVDLPWTAEAEQTRTVENTITTYGASRRHVLDVSRSSMVETKNAEFEFPLYWAVGLVCRWNNVLYTTFDVSETQWSEFSYRAEGGEKLNPLDGSPYGVNGVDDCWSARCGVEYLWVLRWTEIPVRGGVSWEERPAIGEPDEYWGLSFGSGISIGKDPGKLIVDAAYMYTWGEDVLGSLVPGQEGLTTDVTKHQGYVSCICHF